MHSLKLLGSVFVALFSISHFTLNIADSNDLELESPSSHSYIAYDLGGPCKDSGSYEPSRRDIDREVTSKNWIRAIELSKLSVRNMCTNQYRWYELGEMLIAAGKEAEVIQMLNEMLHRGFDVKPSDMRYQPELVSFLQTKRFRESKVGKNIAAALKTMEIRRIEFRKKLKELASSGTPRMNYVAMDVCPFECCAYGDWNTTVSTDLVDRPKGTDLVATIPDGVKVTGVTGNVYLRPLPLGIIHDHPPFSAGDLIFLLNYMGEGYYAYWWDGEISKAEIYSIATKEDCIRPTRDCWVITIDQNTSSDSDWWVKIALPGGGFGWTNQTKNFSGIDLCS